MKKILIFWFFLFTSVNMLNAQDSVKHKGVVDVISNYPIFIYSLPAGDYVEVGKASTAVEIIKVAANERNSLEKKITKIVETALKRKEKNKLSDFDALIIDIDNDKVKAIKFNKTISREAYMLKEKGVSIFLFSKPEQAYEEIAKIPAVFSRRARNGLLYDKINYLVKTTLKKVEKGEIDSFDAMLFNPEDISAVAIKFK